MPLNPDSPNTKNVPGPPAEKSLTKMHIHQFRAIIDPNGVDGSKIQLSVKWSEGYEDEGTYYPVNHYSKTFEGAALEAAMDENTTGGTFYGEVKARLWGWLQEQGDAPAGNVV
jgi:hypothetical protein